MASSMADKLRYAKEAKEGESLPKEQDLKISNEEPVQEGTEVSISEEKDVKPEDAEKERPKPVPKKNRRGSKQLMAELEAAKTMAEGNKEKYTRLLAEFDNMRTRNEKENAKMFDFGAKDTLEKLLPVVDNLERALESVPEDQKNGFEEGVEKIYKQLMDVLSGIGVVPMEAVGKEFNPDFHNAVVHVEDESQPENIVVEEMQKGYMYKDQVLRYSMVKVAN